MSTPLWILIYVLHCILTKWIISWGGAAYIRGWKTWFVFNISQSEEWTKDQVIMMAWFFWIAFTILFLIGLFNPEFRFYKLKNSL
ncbi:MULTISPECIES: hypothetical protein [unclassified Acinetobacter]|uniref:Uncharacterized protein n=1 Tax=Acinetobacter pseudolwoffii TaxID=2053287 RepID=A0A2H9YPL4_9GAMM|nr:MULTISPECIES: hypothetical protein [unclassified Acinetobacter]PJO74588.1 hypothetical protein CWI32_12690 [Acinetobacter pseudolwoffii]